MSSNRIEASLRSFCGIAAVAATIALSMPGLQVARADDDATGAPAAAAMSVDPLLVEQAAGRARVAPGPKPATRQTPSCENPGRPSTLEDALAEHQAQQMLREIARRATAQQAAPQSTEQGIVLNGRGYNYRPTGPAGP